MKLILAILIGFRLTSLADSFRLEGEAFNPSTNIEVVWSLTPTNLPNGLWVYRVAPQSFSTDVLSNLLTACGLGMKDRSIPTELRAIDANAIRFHTENERGITLRNLVIAPNLGWIAFQDTSANPKAPLESAPDTNEVRKLAMQWLYQAGIDRTEIAAKTRSISETTTQRGNNPELITGRGVSLIRMIDGIQERGSCFDATFGTSDNKPKLLSFELNWRNLVPYRANAVATVEEMTSFIRNGKATIPPQGIDLASLKGATKLTVTTFLPIYFNKVGFQQVDYEYPYAVMDIVADIGKSNSVSFTLNCPILSAK